MQKRPTISVIIPTYNGARFINETVNCVLAQTMKPIEIIIVDDGSTDETSIIVTDLANLYPQIKLLRQANKGVSSARNTGIRESKGNYIALLDQDDLWLSNYLEQMNKYIQSGEITSANYQLIDEQGKILGASNKVRAEEIHLPGILTSTHIFLSGSIFPRYLWEKIGPFDENLVGAGAEDWEWFARAVIAGVKIQLVPILLWQYRTSNFSSTYNFGMMADNTKRVLDKIFGYENLPSDLYSYRSHAYYINYVITAGKFYAVGDKNNGLYYLEQAYKINQREFRSLQTFISFLKIYAQTGNHNLAVRGEETVSFVIEVEKNDFKRNLLMAFGHFTLFLLTFRQINSSIQQLEKAFKLYPAFPLYAGFYRVLLRYTNIYALELFNQFKVRLGFYNS